MEHATIVTGMGFGDEGKGAEVDWQTRNAGATLIVRYNGGPQAGHNVVDEDGTRHCFSQFGSSLSHNPYIETYLSEYMLISPFHFLEEKAKLMKVRPKRDIVYVDGAALVITPFHIAANRGKEIMRDINKHGSCGLGVGETREFDLAMTGWSLRVEDLLNTDLTVFKLKAIQDHYSTVLLQMREFIRKDPSHPRMRELLDQIDVLSSKDFINDIVVLFKMFLAQITVVNSLDQRHALFDSHDHVVFEGAQGVLLDENFGFAPHNTWTDCTHANANKLLFHYSKTFTRQRLGLFRAYHTRHGAGPFPTEVEQHILADVSNPGNPWQGDFRYGHFDMVLADYALSVNPVDALVISCFDELIHMYPQIGNDWTAEVVPYCSRWFSSEWGEIPDLDPTDHVNSDFLSKIDPVLDNTSLALLPHLIVDKLGVPILRVGIGPTAAERFDVSNAAAFVPQG